MKRHLYLWAYDISCNRSRRQVREILRGYAALLGKNDRLQVVRLSESAQPFFYGCAKSMAYEPFVIG